MEEQTLLLYRQKRYYPVKIDVTTQNVLSEAEDDTIFEELEEQELSDPSVPVVSDDGHIVYPTRFIQPELSGVPILTDFGQARPMEPENTDWWMPDLYRAPEVLLKLPWESPVDVWCVGVMTLELLEGRNLFDPVDREANQYVLPLALAQYIAYLGPPPLELLKKSPIFPTFFDQDGNQHAAPLEQLPPEVRCLLLSFLAFDELRALVHASPTFHQQYLADRRSLLVKCLETTLGSVAVDAWAVFKSSSSAFADTRTRKHVFQFVESYRDRRSMSLRSILAEESFTGDDAVAMITFSSSIIKPLVQHYATWALANLSNETTNHSHGHDEFPLSTTEELRIIRSLYRFQLCCNLSGVSQHKSLRLSLLKSVDTSEILEIVLFEPWEVEEMLCIYAFGHDKFDQIFRDIHWDVHPDNPKFDDQHRPPTPDGAFDLDNSYGKELYPPLAWTLIWHGTYSNLYGWYIPDEIRRWGYVMWDAARLERTGGKELLMRQWIEYWDEDYDPRDDLMS
ncbi:hypothetical protein DV738_g3796, partial [Chaetothyriales sp. CBS 135597]